MTTHGTVHRPHSNTSLTTPAMGGVVSIKGVFVWQDESKQKLDPSHRACFDVLHAQSSFRLSHSPLLPLMCLKWGAGWWGSLLHLVLPFELAVPVSIQASWPVYGGDLIFLMWHLRPAAGPHHTQNDTVRFLRGRYNSTSHLNHCVYLPLYGVTRTTMPEQIRYCMRSPTLGAFMAIPC